jgi:hypothetical protein
LDLVIALEAALLGGAQSELRYRFGLYGALFLRRERDPSATVKDLRDVYDIRSKLVHGTPISAEKRHAGEELARDLPTAVIRAAIETGWPQATDLDRAAIGRA